MKFINLHASIKIIFLLLLFFYKPAFASSQQLLQINLFTSSSKPRLVLFFNNKPSYKLFNLHDPERVVIDLKNTKKSLSVKNLSRLTLPFVAIRSGPLPDGSLRLVIDLTKTLVPNVVSDTAKQLVIELSENSPSGKLLEKSSFDQEEKNETAELATDSAFAMSEGSMQENDESKNGETKFPILTTLKNKKDLVIVIDPGHGGKDPGAIGASGAREKMVVLGIAKQLQNLINQTPGMRAVLTRRGDYYIGLRERLNIARKSKPDMFVAIHADAYNEPDAQGSSVYALSMRGASSEAARWLAEKENYSELGGVNLEDKSDLLRSVLIDLSQTATISASLQVGAAVLSQLGKISRLHYSHVEQARFVVLKAPDIPSLLIETGFISNPQEERRLSESAQQQKIAKAIQLGVLNYFNNQNISRGVVMQEEKMDKLIYKPIKKKLHLVEKHTILPGETLKIVAEKYSVEIDDLRQFNQLKSGVHAGQVIKIPG